MYLIDDRRYEAGQFDLQDVLAAAYERRVRPVCMCAQPHSPFYIARLGNTFVLKRMPLSGSCHALECPHYAPPAESSGIGKVHDTSSSKTPHTQTVELRVDFSLLGGSARECPPVHRANGLSSTRSGVRLSLRGLVNYLWMEAELTSWRPGFEGKRSWAVVQSHLLAAASKNTLKGLPLLDVLYVPEPFLARRAEAIRARRDVRFANALGLSGQGQARKMILVGELKQIRPARMHFNIVIKHLPDVPFFMRSDLHRRMALQFKEELMLWIDNPECHLIVGATFDLTDWGRPAIDEACLIFTSAQWIPAANRSEKLHIERLVRDRRTFDTSPGSGLSLPSTRTLADRSHLPLAQQLP